MNANETTLPGAGTAQTEPGAEPLPQTEKPRRGDKPPRARTRKKEPSGSEKARKAQQGAAMKARSKTLEAKLSELLMFPAVPAAMAARDPFTQAYMIEHFTRSGPRTAGALVEASEANPQLREWLERITAGGSLFAVAIASFAYAAPPIIWVLGMREQASRITQATTMDAAELEAMLQSAHAAAAQTAAAQHDGAQNAASAAAAPGADAGDDVATA
jgi:hypothetical protein